MSTIQDRKKQHISLASKHESQMQYTPFSTYKLPYIALPELDLSQVQTATAIFGKQITQPLIIASMTGGEAYAQTINKNLAIAAEETGVAMGVGSQRVAIEVDEARESFEIVRKHAPNAVIFANMAVVQLNYGYTVNEYQQVVNMVGADGLYLHINPLQEAIQPEGDTNFSGLFDKIENLITNLHVPVYVKEVGHGLDLETCEKLIKIGVAGIDLAGTGGTSWAWIEAQRAQSDEFSDWFKEFGNPADTVLSNISNKDIDIVVSGGIRNPLQGLKARALGADYYSAAQPFLEPALRSDSEVTSLIQTWQRGLQIGMFASGVDSWDMAREIELV